MKENIRKKREIELRKEVRRLDDETRRKEIRSRMAGLLFPRKPEVRQKKELHSILKGANGSSFNHKQAVMKKTSIFDLLGRSARKKPKVRKSAKQKSVFQYRDDKEASLGLEIFEV